MAAHLLEFTNRYPSFKNAGREENPPLAIAFSGGADSTALVWAADELGLRMRLLHVNYGLRGEESDGDERFVQDLGQKLGVEVCVLRPPVPAANEETLREIRYQWFREFDFVCTAHTLDDQAETVLHRILRGTGPEGLAGIQPVLQLEEGRHLGRPLLGLRRAELREYLRSRAKTWREDSSNQEFQYRRNWIRQVLLPLAEERINPEAATALARLADLAREEEDWLGPMLDDFLPFCAKREGKAWILDAKNLANLHKATQRRVVRGLLERMEALEGVGFEHLERILGLVNSPSGDGRVQAPGLDFLRSFDEIRVIRQADLDMGPRNFRLELKVGEKVLVPAGGGVVQTTLEEISHYNEIGQNRASGLTEDLDWGLLEAEMQRGNPLELRNWRPGDEYQRVGRDRPERLKELFQKFRIPLWQRRSWPIVVLKDEPIWARSFGSSAVFTARPGGRKLKIEWLPSSEADV